MTIVVNFVGGPGAGKSTITAGVFAKLKRAGIDAEIATEYAKDIIWDNSNHLLANQIRLLGEQYHRIWRLNNKVDVVVTDCPLFLSLYYGKDRTQSYLNLVMDLFNEFDNMTFYLNRSSPYVQNGRWQTEQQAHEVDQHLFNLLKTHNIPYCFLTLDEAAENVVVQKVLEKFKEENDVD